MIEVILYLWLSTAATNNNFAYMWVPSGEFAGMKACESAVQKLGVRPDRARCIESGRVIQARQGE